MDDRTRGVMLQRIEFPTEELITEGNERLSPPAPFTQVRIGQATEHAVVEHNGQAYLVDSEGVIYDVNALGVKMPVYFSTETSLAIVPQGQLSYRWEQLLSFRTDEDVDLADFVRRFGARLEQNFILLYRELSS